MSRCQHGVSRKQAGVSLLEVLLALVVSATILVPLTAWAILGFEEQARTVSRVADTNESNLLATYLSRDVHSAAGITTGGDCVGGEGDSASGVASRVLLSVAADDPVTTRVAYTLAPSRDDATEMSIWRRTCATAPAAGELPAVTELVSGLDPTAVVEATCTSTPTDAACGQVTLSYPGRSGKVVSHSASRRSGTRWPS